jgi:hypothetical protein
MKQQFKNIEESFKPGDNGYMARKLTSFAFMICVAYIHLRYVDTENAVEALMVDSLMVLLLLGIITSSQLIKLYILKKHGANNENGAGHSDSAVDGGNNLGDAADTKHGAAPCPYCNKW